MDNTSEALFSLQRVAFRYNTEIDCSGAEQFGLVAEDVEKVHPGLIVHDKEGKAYSVRYDQVNAMLLNEFLKEHKKVQQQGATISKLQADATRQQATVAEMKMTLDKVVERLNEHEAKIQNVGVDVELSRNAQQKVASDP